MNNSWISSIEKAFQKASSIQNLLASFIALVVCSLFFAFAESFVSHVGPWVQAGLSVVPTLLSLGVLLSFGVWLEHRQSKRPRPLSQTLWDALSLSLAYFFVSFIVYLALWVLLGIYALIAHVPTLGTLWVTLFAFIPPLIQLMTLILIVLNVGLLFFLPTLIQPKEQPGKVLKHALDRFSIDPVASLIAFFIALVPTIVAFGVIDFISYDPFMPEKTVSSFALYWWIRSWCFSALLAWPLLFFFSFASVWFKSKRVQ